MGSPSLKLAHSFLSKQILICGTIGIAPELFTQNFLVFQVPKDNKIHSQLFPSNSLDELSKHNDNQIVSAKMWLHREDHVLIKDLFENENTYFRPNRKCKIHSAP